MRSVVSRLACLERLNRLNTAPQRFRIQYGYLTTLPTITSAATRRHNQANSARGTTAGRARAELFEWEVRPGPEPGFAASEPNEILVHVRYVEGKAKA